MRLMKRILSVIVGVSNNYQGQCDPEGGEELMKKVRTLFVAIKVKVETLTKEMTERTAIRFRKFMDPIYFFKHSFRTNVSTQHNQLHA